jgi:F-type H+-transporting ATPase subunit g
VGSSDTDRFPIGQVPFVIYYSKVGIELSKMVFKGQNMTPP